MARVERGEPRIPIRSVTLETTLVDIPDGPPCIACGSQTEKTYLAEHRSLGEKVIVKALGVAGYRCNECDYECYSHEAILESLSKARDIMLHKGDQKTALLLETPIASRKAMIDLRRLDNAASVRAR